MNREADGGATHRVVRAISYVIVGTALGCGSYFGRPPALFVLSSVALGIVSIALARRLRQHGWPNAAFVLVFVGSQLGFRLIPMIFFGGSYQTRWPDFTAEAGGFILGCLLVFPKGRPPAEPMRSPEPLEAALFSPGVGKCGMTQLHFDAYCGNLEGLLWCLEHGFEVNAADDYRGYTATHWLADMAAVDGPRVEMLRALAAHGADLNAKSANGETPLTLARAAGSNLGEALAAELFELGART
jgi:hypothetical protein